MSNKQLVQDLTQQLIRIISETNGIAVEGRADFVFWPEREGQGRPIAIFADGNRSCTAFARICDEECQKAVMPSLDELVKISILSRTST